MGDITWFYATEETQQHMLEKHNVVFEEIEEVAEGPHRIVGAHDGPKGEPRDMLVGKTDNGRRLLVIFEDQGNGTGRVVTAREPRNKKERARHRKFLDE